MEKRQNRRGNQVTLKMLAQHLCLAPGTVSKVLNNANGSQSISPQTKARILDAARELQYEPNFLAQSLRTKRSYMIGVLVPEIGDSEGGLVVAGVERTLRHRGYLFLTGVHHNNAEMLENYMSLFQRRGVEGVLTVDVAFSHESVLPIVSVVVPRDWATEERPGIAPTWGSSSWSSTQTRRFIERLGETATETLLTQIQGAGSHLSQLSRHPELASRPNPTYPQGLSG